MEIRCCQYVCGPSRPAHAFVLINGDCESLASEIFRKNSPSCIGSTRSSQSTERWSLRCAAFNPPSGLTFYESLSRGSISVQDDHRAVCSDNKGAREHFMHDGIIASRSFRRPGRPDTGSYWIAMRRLCAGRGQPSGSLPADGSMSMFPWRHTARNRPSIRG